MAFIITEPYTVAMMTGGMYAPGTVEQAGAFYAVRIREPAVGEAGALECDSLGPYATASEAAGHLDELPPAPPARALTAPGGPDEPTDV